MKCENCGSEQDEGRFCGNCGTPLHEASPENAHSSPHTQVENEGLLEKEQEREKQEKIAAPEVSHEATDKVKHSTKMYGTYFVGHLKRPSLAFTKREESFKHGLINLAIITVLMALSAYMLARNLIHAGYGYNNGGMFTDTYSSTPPLFPVFGYTFVFSIISIAIVIFLLYAINQLFGTAYSMKKMVSVYAAHLIPVIVLTGIAFILILLKSNTIGGYLLLLALGLVMTTLPVYLISSLLTRRPKNMDPVYAYLIYLVITGIAFVIFVFIMMDSTFGRVLDQIGYY